MKFKIEYSNYFGGSVTIDGIYILWRPDGLGIFFEQEGFAKVEAVKYRSIWIGAPQELRDYYCEHEEEIKQEARKLIVKEML